MEVPDLHKVSVTENGDIVVRADDYKENEIDEAKYLKECFLLQDKKSFTLDTGSSVHVVKDAQSLSNKRNIDFQMSNVNAISVIEVEGDIQCDEINIHDVKLMVGAPRNLISAHRLTE